MADASVAVTAAAAGVDVAYSTTLTRTFDPSNERVVTNPGTGSYLLSTTRPKQAGAGVDKCCREFGIPNSQHMQKVASCYMPKIEVSRRWVEQESKAAPLNKHRVADTANYPEDVRGTCGSGIVDVSHVTHPWFYHDIRTCMQLTRQIGNDNRYCPGNAATIAARLAERKRQAELEGKPDTADEDGTDAAAAAETVMLFHVYWSGQVQGGGPHEFHRQAALYVRSWLATQDMSQSKLWIWSHRDLSKDKHAAPFAGHPNIEFKVSTPKEQCRGTVLESQMNTKFSWAGEVGDKLNWANADVFRLLILWHYGGVWMDIDTILLRDLSPLLGSEFMYKWGVSCVQVSGAMIRFFKGSPLATTMLERVSTIVVKEKGKEVWGGSMFTAIWLAQQEDATRRRAFQVMPACFFHTNWMAWDRKWDLPALPAQWNGNWVFHLSGNVFKTSDNKLDTPGSDYTQIDALIAQRLRERFDGKDFKA